jgi:hypothetical protein
MGLGGQEELDPLAGCTNEFHRSESTDLTLSAASIYGLHFSAISTALARGAWSTYPINPVLAPRCETHT